MKFRYIGDDNQPPQRAVVFGHAFELHGDAVEVADPHAQAKLRGNRTFAEVRPRRKTAAALSTKDDEDGLDEG